MVPSMSSVPMRPHPIWAIWIRRFGDAPCPYRNDAGKNDGATINPADPAIVVCRKRRREERRSSREEVDMVNP